MSFFFGSFYFENGRKQKLLVRCLAFTSLIEDVVERLEYDKRDSTEKDFDFEYIVRETHEVPRLASL